MKTEDKASLTDGESNSWANLRILRAAQVRHAGALSAHPEKTGSRQANNANSSRAKE
jgi:hypothetical protein